VVRELYADRPCRVTRKLRRPGHIAASWTETVVGRDGLAEWAVLAAGAPVHRESGTLLRYQSPQVFCYPHDDWWVARLGGSGVTFHANRRDGTVKVFDNAAPDRVDISTPPVVSPAGVEFVDLVLDVVRQPDGRIEVLDHHELAAEAARWSIPADHIAAARRTCEKVAAMMDASAPPFDGSAAYWLDCFARTHEPDRP
jgi:predicted RNA-binding protein associated with RNAse of E/G family